MSGLNSVSHCDAPQCIEKSRVIKGSDEYHYVNAIGTSFSDSEGLTIVKTQHQFHKNCFKVAVSCDQSFLENGLFSKCPAGKPDCSCSDAVAQMAEASIDPTPAEAVNYAFSFYLRKSQFEKAASLLYSPLLTSKNRNQVLHNEKFKNFIYESHPELECYIREKNPVKKTKQDALAPAVSSSAPASSKKQTVSDEFASSAAAEETGRRCGSGRPRITIMREDSTSKLLKDLQKRTPGMQPSLSLLRKQYFKK